MMPRDITFTNPQAAFLLLALPVFFALFLYAHRSDKSALDKIASSRLLVKIAVLRSPFLSKIKFSFFCLFWILSSIALMEPIGNMHFEKGEGKRSFSTQNIIFLLDVSQSMEVKDTPNKFSRLEYAKELADQIARRLPGNNLMLATFTVGVNQIIPLTRNNVFFRLRLKEVDVNEGGSPPGTDFLKSLAGLKGIYSKDPSLSYQTLIILSDGEDLENVQSLDTIASFLSPKEFPHLKVYAIGVGSQEGGEVPGAIYQGQKVTSRLNGSFLKALSSAGGGRYFSSNQYSSEDLAKEVADLIKKRDAKIQSENLQGAQMQGNFQDIAYSEYFQVPLTLGILFFILAFFLPESYQNGLKMFFVFTVCLHPLFSYAQEDAFAAKQAFEAQDFNTAIAVYEGLLKQNISFLGKQILKYDLGTAYAAAGQWDSAIELLSGVSLEAKQPLLKKRARINLALAYYHKAFLETDPANQIHFLELALNQMDQAEKESCLKENCITPFEIQQAKLQFKNALSKKQNAFLTQSTLPPQNSLASMLMLLRGVSQGVQHLESEELPVNLKNRYFDFYAKIMKEAGAGLPNLASVYKSEDSQKQVKETKTLHQEAVRAFEHKDWEGTKQLIVKMQSKMEELFRSYYSQNAGSGLLQDLETLYRQAEENASPLAYDFLKLNLLQKSALSLFPNDTGLKAANDDLQASIGWMKKENAFAARLYLIKGLLEARKALHAQESPSPQSDLSALIDEAEAVLSVERLFLEYAEESSAFKDQWGSLENLVTALAKLFPKNVFEWQKKQFRAGKCQCKPWDKVFPAFFQGLLFWLGGLREYPKDPLGSFDLHGASLKSWKEALALLKNIPENQPYSGEQESRSETVEELEEMQSQDKIPEMQKPLPKGGKTW